MGTRYYHKYKQQRKIEEQHFTSAQMIWWEPPYRDCNKMKISGSVPPRSSQQPGPSSSRSTPDLLNKIQDLFGSDEDKPKLRSSKDVRKVTDNLEQSYQYFKDKHAKAENDEGRNKVCVKQTREQSM